MEVHSGGLGVNEGIFCVSQQCSGVGGAGWGIFWVDWGGWTIFVGEWGWVEVGRGKFLVNGCVWTFFMVG